MEALKTALLLVVVLVPFFLTLDYFGLMVTKSGYRGVGNTMGTPTKFWGEYRNLCGSVSKRFRIAGKYMTLSLQLEAVSGSARVEILGPNKEILYIWSYCSSLSEQIDCRNWTHCTVRITSENFCGKFDISLQ